MNNLTSNYDNGSQEEFDCQLESQAIDLFFLAATSLLGTAGNFLIIVSVFCLPGMQRSMNWLIANIAIADIIICLYIIPTIFVNRVSCRNRSHPTVCLMNAFLVFMCAGVSNFSFMMIAINRRMFVLDRNTYSRVFSRKMIIFHCILIWVLWLLFSLVMRFLHAFHYIGNAFACFYFDDEAPFAASFILTLLGVALPTLIALFCYVSIFYSMFQARMRAMKQQIADSSLGEKLNMFNREKRSLIAAVVAFSLFNICWGPYSVHVYIDKFIALVPDRAHKTVLWMSIMNSALNPMVYGALNSQFRNSFKKILHFRRPQNQVETIQNASIILNRTLNKTSNK